MVAIFFTIEFFTERYDIIDFDQLNESEDMVMDIVAIMKERHSVRQYKNQVIDHSKREEINAFVNAINAESKLAIQVFYDEPKCFDSFMVHYGNLKM